MIKGVFGFFYGVVKFFVLWAGRIVGAVTGPYVAAIPGRLYGELQATGVVDVAKKVWGFIYG